MSPSPATDTSSPRRLGVATATLLVVASMVGTGVFTTTGLLVRDLGSPSAVLVAWLVGGLLALCGALSYSELAASIPRNGGEYSILSRVYHPSVGFVAGFISLVVGFSAPIAASALAFGQYFSALVPGVNPHVAAVGLVLGLSALHALHVRMGSGLQNVLTAANVALIVGIIVGGLWLGNPGHLAPESATPLRQALFSPAFAIGLVFVSFSYSGWNGAAYLAGELRKPARTLPIALGAGTLLVILLFLGLNVVFLSAAPHGELSGVVEVGHVAAMRLFGPKAGTLLSGVIALALVSSSSAMTMSGPRVYQAMGQHFPRLGLLRYRTRRGGPAMAVGLQALVALVMVVTATFEVLLTYIGFTLSLVAGLTVLGVLVYRHREPLAPRPYRAWGYPATPLLFVALSAWMIVHALIERPVVALAGLGTVAAGAVLYLLIGRRAPDPDASAAVQAERLGDSMREPSSEPAVPNG
jgi:APA family basic amino acid/polyamine antiporter